MNKTDSRINTSIVSKRTSILYTLIFILYGGLLLKIYDNIEFTPENAHVLAAAILALIFVSSICLALATSYFQYINNKLPLLKLADAAREVAKGNYSVKLPPHRKDGKIDEIEALYEDFNSMVEELASTEILKTSFVSNISHELKTPIAVISNYAALLQDKSISVEEQKQYADKINTVSHDLAELINNILQISKLDNNQVEAKNESFDLSEMLIQAILSFDSLLEEKNIDLQINIPDNISIESDPGLLKIAFNNILSNAIKFSDDSGQIEIKVNKEDSKTSISVRDQGCGMDEKALKHIFDKFYQSDKNHSAKGNGLGLAMVKQIIFLLKGNIEVQSRPGQGSLFTITLPNSPS
ncbi:MAG: HAMP domain-containing histidine kinase [Lachnospiraceae bacterium]|nr:HAMP domain-containing histidine kinase [Lachnospiraceae bacterium]